MKIAADTHFHTTESKRNTQYSGMTWESLLDRLTSRGKVETVAITNLEGEVLASTADWDLTDGETIGILKAVSSHYDSLIRMKITDTMYTCFRHDNSETIVGKAENRVLVAHICHQCMVIGFSDIQSPGSCIYDITEFGKHIEKRGL
ncbi:hypothetical protein LOTGIDRAFT_227877 [Lottia gigantea]|uniref:Roadblock/LAMTOR2 domain-containing protein n=1 Tax=Lottia gigantea TaxID=225164 RepID=V4B434_LOTGI|nr:hypothetical protein LOTGIDRAFT_227877 [Lottia gigantea]ESP05213.1 hypothetical protein LOTGIDRAFT_227877 [Lottia gigantea]